MALCSRHYLFGDSTLLVAAFVAVCRSQRFSGRKCKNLKYILKIQHCRNEKGMPGYYLHFLVQCAK